MRTIALEQTLAYRGAMPRPRLHDLEQLLDVAEKLVAESGPSGLTLRALAAAAGASNGSIYHAFTSKEELLARLWVRTSERTLAVLLERVDTATRQHPDEPAEAVVAAALTPLELARNHPDAARIFFSQRRESLFSQELSAEVRAGLDSVQRRFTDVLLRLAENMWSRRDRIAVDAIACCVVDLPGGLVRRQLFGDHGVDPQTEARITASVRAILDLPLADPPTRRASTRARGKDRTP